MGSVVDQFVARVGRTFPDSAGDAQFRVVGVHDPFVGKKLGGNLVLQRVGQGAMSVVYKGKQQITERPVAIKLLRITLCSDRSNVGRFQREAKALSKLAHANLVTVYEVGQSEGGQPFFTMDYIEGASLSQIIECQGAIPWTRVLAIFVQVCEAMEHAHQKGVIHRDLKPENIMLVNAPGQPDQVKVVDFGIVKLTDESQLLSQKLTKTGEVWGSPVYMSPEQCLGSVLDFRTDIYSLGTVLYECLVGRPVFESKRIADIVVKQIKEMPVAPSVVRPELAIPRALEQIVFMALQKDPAQRFQTMRQLRDALSQGLSSCQTENPLKMPEASNPITADRPEKLDLTLAVKSSTSETLDSTRVSQPMAVESSLNSGSASQAEAQDSTRISKGMDLQQSARQTPAGNLSQRAASQAVQPSAAANEDPHLGSKLAGRFTVISRIGEGGMSAVYRAKQEIVDRNVAIKMLHMDLCFDETNVKRFEREARAICKLSHPHLITVYDVGISETGQPFYAMEYIQGYSLAELIAAERMIDVGRALPIFVQVADAMEHAHKCGIVHRDLKPENIMLLVTKEQDDYVKIVDFGIVKAIDENNVSQRLTKTDEIWGSPAYMSPEQCMGEKLDARSDIYSLGTVMYEALTGKVIFDDKNISHIISKQVTDMPKTFNSVRHDLQVPESVEAIVFKALQKNPAKRYQSMAELKRALEKVSGSIKNAGATTTSSSVPEVKGRRLKGDGIGFKAALAVFAFILLALALTGSWLLYQNVMVPIMNSKQEEPAQRIEQQPQKQPGSGQTVKDDGQTARDNTETSQRPAGGANQSKTKSVRQYRSKTAEGIDLMKNVDVLDPADKPRRKYQDQYKYYDQVPAEKSAQ